MPKAYKIAEKQKYNLEVAMKNSLYFPKITKDNFKPFTNKMYSLPLVSSAKDFYKVPKYNPKETSLNYKQAA